MHIVDALAARGTVAVVGAGGKKTTLYALANELDRSVITATVRIPIFDSHVTRVVVTDDPAATITRADEWPLGVIPARERRDGADRYRGYDTTVIDELSAVVDGLDALLVKADGARTRLLKAPSDREPQVPACADTVIAIASARVVGESLTDEHVHRPERVAAVTGRSPGSTISPADVATVLASEQGGLKDVPDDARVVALVNMVDTDALARTGREIARGVHERTDRVDRVVLARMAERHVIDVV